MDISTIYLLYYRAPYEEEPELLCACMNHTFASNMMYYYKNLFPDAYPDINRFETKPIELIGPKE